MTCSEPMAPRVRGERSADAPRTQAACECVGGLCPWGIGRSPGPVVGRAAIGCS